MDVRGWVLGGAAAAVFSGAACTPAPDYLFVDPRVQPVRVELRKSFGTLEQGLRAGGDHRMRVLRDPEDRDRHGGVSG